jgi:transmembrane sensor
MTGDSDGHQQGSDEFARLEAASAWCIRLAERTVSDRVRREFEAWLSEDAENARAFAQVARTWQSFGVPQSPPELLAMRRDALERFHSAQACARVRAPTRRMFAGFAAAAVAAVAVFVAVGLEEAPRSFETGLGERRVVALEDGSSISLDSQTRVEVRYSDERRELRLVGGRAKFSVAHDAARPFAVTAANRTVVATGTQFSVELLRANVHVILYEGGVDVLKDSDVARASETARVRLQPGRELIASLEDDTHAVREADLESSLAWEAGQIAFDDEPLTIAVERMNRYSAATLQVGDAAAGRIRISGTFAAGDTDAFVEGIASIFPVRVIEIADRRVFVSSSP